MRLTSEQLADLAVAAERRARELEDQARRAQEARLFRLADSAAIKAARCRRIAREARRRAHYRALDDTPGIDINDEMRRLMEGEE